MTGYDSKKRMAADKMQKQKILDPLHSQRRRHQSKRRTTMTQVDVLKMAIEAGLAAETSDGLHQIWYPDNLYHFAKLVAEHEREACAKLCEDCIIKGGEVFAAKIRARGEQA